MPDPLTPIPARIADLRGDVSLTGLASGDTLVRNGTRWVNAKTGGVFYPSVAGDGTTDDTPPIRASVAAAKAGGGGIVELPAGMFSITGPIVLPSDVWLRGKGPGASTLTRPATVLAALTADALATTTTVTVGSTAGFLVGWTVAVWDDAGSGTTFAVILSKTATTLNVDTPMDFDFTTARHASVASIFQFITNEPASMRIRVSDLTLDHNRAGTEPDNYFMFSPLEWRNTYDSVVKNCRIIRPVGDGYSDQSRDYRTFFPDLVAAITPTGNRLEDCEIDGAPNFGAHLGTLMGAGYLLRNRIKNSGREAIHYSAYIRRTVCWGNLLEDNAVGFGSLDPRDIGNTIENNDIYRCTGESISAGGAPETRIVGNRIYDPVGHAIHCQGDDCLVSENKITMGTSVSIGIWIDGGSRAVVEGNTVDGGATGSFGIAIGNSSDSRVIGNSLNANDTGVLFAADTRLTLSGNAIASPLSGTALSCTATCVDCTLNLNPTVGSFLGITNLTRGIINGMGDNGSVDPATGGSWNSISGRQWDGTTVRWNDGLEHYSSFHNGVWSRVSSAVLVSPTFTPTNTTTAALTAQGLSGQAQVQDWIAFGGTRKGRFSFKNFVNTYAGLTLEGDAVPNIRFVGTTTNVGEGGAIFFCNTSGVEIWQNYRPADTGGYGVLNRQVGGSVGSFGFAFLADTANRLAFGTPVSGTGYIPPTLTNQFTFYVGDPARSGVVVVGFSGQTSPLFVLQGVSSTAAVRDMATVATAWNVSTDASRLADLIFSSSGFNGAHEAIRFRDTGAISQPIIPIANVRDAADDTAAAALSPAVPVGGLYRTGSALKIRVS